MKGYDQPTYWSAFSPQRVVELAGTIGAGAAVGVYEGGVGSTAAGAELGALGYGLYWLYNWEQTGIWDGIYNSIIEAGENFGRKLQEWVQSTFHIYVDAKPWQEKVIEKLPYWHKYFGIKDAGQLLDELKIYWQVRMAAKESLTPDDFEMWLSEKYYVIGMVNDPKAFLAIFGEEPEPAYKRWLKTGKVAPFFPVFIFFAWCWDTLGVSRFRKMTNNLNVLDTIDVYRAQGGTYPWYNAKQDGDWPEHPYGLKDVPLVDSNYWDRFTEWLQSRYKDNDKVWQAVVDPETFFNIFGVKPKEAFESYIADNPRAQIQLPQSLYMFYKWCWYKLAFPRFREWNHIDLPITRQSYLDQGGTWGTYGTNNPDAWFVDKSVWESFYGWLWNKYLPSVPHNDQVKDAYSDNSPANRDYNSKYAPDIRAAATYYRVVYPIPSEYKDGNYFFGYVEKFFKRKK